MVEKEVFRESTEAVHAHLQILQSAIQRMSSNSASSKAWCITSVSAILVLLSDRDKADQAWLALLPTVLFLVLDAYYLALERGFRNSYDAFVDKLHNGRLIASDFYAVVPMGSIPRKMGRTLLSFSVWPFYGVLVILICVLRLIML
jgi:hypothetical protein